MSKKYKDAMDKIIASDEIKSRVLTAAAEKIADSEKSHIKRVRKIYIKRAIGYAACFAVCITSVMLYRNFRTDNVSVPPEPIYTQTPITPDTTAAPAVPEGESAVMPAAGQGENSVKSAAPGKSTPSGGNSSASGKGTPSGGNSATSGKGTPSGGNSAKAETPAATPSQTQTDAPGQNGQSPAASAPETGGKADTPDVKADTPTATPDGDLESSLPPDGVCGGNPFAESASLDELYKDAGYAFKMPYSLPEGYSLSGCALIDGTLVQITYDNGTDTILYRTEKSSEDISGDYNTYPNTVTVDINGITADARGYSGKYYSTVWQEGESSYAIGSTGGLAEEDVKNIIAGIDYYKKGE